MNDDRDVGMVMVVVPGGERSVFQAGMCVGSNGLSSIIHFFAVPHHILN
jgi:hypothetical protein